MHVVAPARYHSQPKPKPRKPVIRLLLVLLVVAGTINYLRPLPPPVASLSVTMPATAQNLTLAWPGQGQAAVAASGYGLLGATGTQAPLATASIAKVILALCVLQKQPLPAGQAGPSYTMTAQDVQFYQDYVAQNGSNLPVTAGESLTEYEALEALMLPSANNIADSLVNKIFGGQSNYSAYATGFLQQHGINQTHIGSDASGFDPSTTSTATDLANLGLLALKSPVLIQIASQRLTVLPVAGTVYNYNTVLGTGGITGLKTGNNDADPGAFLFTATTTVGGKTIQLAGSVMGADDLQSALQSAVRLSRSAGANFEQLTLANAGQTVGHVTTKWGTTAAITPTQSLSVVRWKTTPLTETHSLHISLGSTKAGSLNVTAGQARSTTDLVLSHAVAGPSFWWRLTRH